MCTVFMNVLHFAVRWSSRQRQCPTCHPLQGQRKLGSSRHASAQSAGLVFWTLKTVQCMQPSSPLNQTDSEHIIYLFCLTRRLWAPSWSFLKFHSHSCNDLCGYPFHLTADLWKISKVRTICRNIPWPVIREMCNDYSVCKNHSFWQFILKCEWRHLDLKKVCTCEVRKTNTLASLKTPIHSHEKKETAKGINTWPERLVVTGK